MYGTFNRVYRVVNQGFPLDIFRSQSISFQIVTYFYESFLESSEHGGRKAFQLKSKEMPDKKYLCYVLIQL